MEQRRRHGPGIEIGAAPSGGRLVEGRVDIIRPAFEPGDFQAAPSEGAHQAERQSGLAAARARRSDDETGRIHRTMRWALSASRKPTIAPITTKAGAAPPCGGSSRAATSVVSTIRWLGKVAS